jgi:hypothetical protein
MSDSSGKLLLGEMHDSELLSPLEIEALAEARSTRHTLGVGRFSCPLGRRRNVSSEEMLFSLEQEMMSSSDTLRGAVRFKAMLLKGHSRITVGFLYVWRLLWETFGMVLVG